MTVFKGKSTGNLGVVEGEALVTIDLVAFAYLQLGRCRCGQYDVAHPVGNHAADWQQRIARAEAAIKEYERQLPAKLTAWEQAIKQPSAWTALDIGHSSVGLRTRFCRATRPDRQGRCARSLR